LFNVHADAVWPKYQNVQISPKQIVNTNIFEIFVIIIWKNIILLKQHVQFFLFTYLKLQSHKYSLAPYSLALFSNKSIRLCVLKYINFFGRFMKQLHTYIFWNYLRNVSTSLYNLQATCLQGTSAHIYKILNIYYLFCISQYVEFSLVQICILKKL